MMLIILQFILNIRSFNNFPNDSFYHNAHICVNRINEFFIWACLLYTFYIETFLLSCAIKFHLDSEWLNMNAWWRYSYSLINAKFSSTKLLCVIAAFFRVVNMQLIHEWPYREMSTFYCQKKCIIVLLYIYNMM